MKTSHLATGHFECDECQRLHEDFTLLDRQKPHYERANRAIIERIEEHVRYQHSSLER